MPYLASFRTLVIGLTAVAGGLMATASLSQQTPAAMYISPSTATVVQGDEQQFSIMVESLEPVNAFTGEITFDNTHFRVTNISYNTSIADLWVEEPWYNRSDNSIYFAGGTTAANGFSGQGTLLTVTLRADRAGDTTLALRNPRIMAHDGLGTDVNLTAPLDRLFTIDTTPYAVPLPTPDKKPVTIVPATPPLDINQDGEIGFRDVSILLLRLGGTDARYDFNGDGSVTWTDVRVWQQLRQTQKD